MDFIVRCPPNTSMVDGAHVGIAGARRFAPGRQGVEGLELLRRQFDAQRFNIFHQAPTLFRPRNGDDVGALGHGELAEEDAEGGGVE